jgi:hypothetical protein
LPVAVELRFQLVDEIPRPMVDGTEALGQRSTGDLAGGIPAEQMRGLAAGDSLEPQDDAIRSAQTQPLEDHRYLILVREPEANVEASDTGILHEQAGERASFEVRSVTP